MKSLYISICLYLFSCHGQAEDDKGSNSQPDSIQSNIQYVEYGCGYTNTVTNTNYSRLKPKIREVDEFNKILKYIGLPFGFELYKSNVKNAVALLDNQRRIILYNETLLAKTDLHNKDYWSSMSIISHELGHHLAGHTFNLENYNSHEKELEADRFSGFVLFKMGATLKEASAALVLLANKVETYSHPNKLKRLEALKSGWLAAQKLDLLSAVPPPPKKSPFDNDPNDLLWFSFSELFDHENDSIDLEDPYYLSTMNNIYTGVIIDSYQLTSGNEDFLVTDPIDIYIHICDVHESTNYKPHKVGQRVKVHLNSFHHLCHVCYDNLRYLAMRKGNTIMFSDYYDETNKQYILTAIQEKPPYEEYDIK